MKSRAKWLTIGIILGFAVAWTAQEFRIGTMQNEALAKSVQPIHEAQNEADKTHDDLMRQIGEFIAHGKKHPAGE